MGSKDTHSPGKSRTGEITDAITAARIQITAEIAAGVIAGSIDNVVEDLTPQLGGNVDLNTKAFKVVGQDCQFAAGELVYLSAANTWSLTDADAEATAKGKLGISLVNHASTGEVLVFGPYTTTGLTAADKYYIHTTAGDWVSETTGAPSGSSDVVRIIGHALSTTVLFFNPDNYYTVVP